MSIVFSQSPQRHLERAGIRPTFRSPVPTIGTNNLLHKYPETWPNPRPDLTRFESGTPAPDRVVTRIWPHGGPPVE